MLVSAVNLSWHVKDTRTLISLSLSFIVRLNCTLVIRILSDKGSHYSHIHLIFLPIKLFPLFFSIPVFQVSLWRRLQQVESKGLQWTCGSVCLNLQITVSRHWRCTDGISGKGEKSMPCVHAAHSCWWAGVEEKEEGGVCWQAKRTSQEGKDVWARETKDRTEESNLLEYLCDFSIFPPPFSLITGPWS